MLFLEESFLRLRHFILACDAYHNDVISGVAVVLSYSGLFTYLFFGVLTLSPEYRDRFMWTLWAGLGATGFLLYAVAELPFARNADATCQAEAGSRPAEEVTIVSFVSVYYYLFVTLYTDVSGWRVLQFLLVLTYWVLSVWALVHLHIQSSLSIIGGGALGIVGACASHWVLARVFNRLDQWPRTRRWLELMHVRLEKLDSMTHRWGH